MTKVTIRHMHTLPTGKTILIIGEFSEKDWSCLDIAASDGNRPLLQKELCDIITPEVTETMIKNHVQRIWEANYESHDNA